MAKASRHSNVGKDGLFRVHSIGHTVQNWCSAKKKNPDGGSREMAPLPCAPMWGTWQRAILCCVQCMKHTAKGQSLPCVMAIAHGKGLSRSASNAFFVVCLGHCTWQRLVILSVFFSIFMVPKSIQQFIYITIIIALISYITTSITGNLYSQIMHEYKWTLVSFIHNH